jgi:hypothetical protein
MNELLTSIEQSALSQAILTDEWWFPILLCVHALGMAFLAGFLMLIDLRLLGLGAQVELAPLRRFYRIIWWALLFNFASGVLMFLGYATKDYYSNSFRIKLLLIVIGLVIARYLQKTILQGPEAGQAVLVPAHVKVLAVVSLGCWIGAITAGRLVAYL